MVRSEPFLPQLKQQGTSRKALRNVSGELLQVVRVLKLTEMRDVSLEEIQRAPADGIASRFLWHNS
jgi:hypothetical protein